MRIGPCVLGLALLVQSSFVADADGVPVVSLAMGAGLFHGSAGMDRPVAGEVVMISDVPEVPVSDVVQATSLEIQAPLLRGGGAMEDDQCDGAHLSVNVSSHTH